MRDAARAVRRKPRETSEPEPGHVTAHDKVLYGCIEYLQQNYPSYTFLHIPNELYELISGLPQDGSLWFVFEKALGKKAATMLKAKLADAFVGVADLTVFSPTGTYMMGEVKVGKDKVHKRQRQKCPMALKVWNTVETFAKDMAAFDNLQSRVVGNDSGTGGN